MVCMREPMGGLLAYPALSTEKAVAESIWGVHSDTLIHDADGIPAAPLEGFPSHHAHARCHTLRKIAATPLKLPYFSLISDWCAELFSPLQTVTSHELSKDLAGIPEIDTVASDPDARIDFEECHEEDTDPLDAAAVGAEDCANATNATATADDEEEADNEDEDDHHEPAYDEADEDDENAEEEDESENDEEDEKADNEENDDEDEEHEDEAEEDGDEVAPDDEADEDENDDNEDDHDDEQAEDEDGHGEDEDNDAEDNEAEEDDEPEDEAALDENDESEDEDDDAEDDEFEDDDAPDEGEDDSEMEFQSLKGGIEGQAREMSTIKTKPKVKMKRRP